MLPTTVARPAGSNWAPEILTEELNFKSACARDDSVEMTAYVPCGVAPGP